MTASGSSDPVAIFNQGIILWNQSKAPEAQVQFEKAAQLDPKMADAQYFLGMTLVNQGKLPDAKKPFETYLSLAPTGQYGSGQGTAASHQVGFILRLLRRARKGRQVEGCQKATLPTASRPFAAASPRRLSGSPRPWRHSPRCRLEDISAADVRGGVGRTAGIGENRVQEGLDKAEG
jgi:tetratricopeptide (TPR) repeat protein